MLSKASSGALLPDRAEASHHGHYYHEYCMAISVERDSPTYQDMTADAEEAVIEALRDLARWLYRQLEREYDHLSSDEAVDETIAAMNTPSPKPIPFRVILR